MRAATAAVFFFTGSFPAGCKVANEYATQADAIEASAAWKSRLSAIGALDRNYEALWSSEQALREWKMAAVPVLQNAGVTTARLYSRSRYHVDPDHRVVSKLLLSNKPRSEITRGGGGWVPVPARYAISGSFRGTVTASRGRASLYGREHTLYAYDIFGEQSDFWLRVVFWDPPPPPLPVE